MHTWIPRLVAELSDASKAFGTWRQSNYKKFIFEVFQSAGGGQDQIPSITGSDVRRLVCEYLKDKPDDQRTIEKTLSEVCDAWDEWVFALRNWRPNRSRM